MAATAAPTPAPMAEPPEPASNEATVGGVCGAKAAAVATEEGVTLEESDAKGTLAATAALLRIFAKKEAESLAEASVASAFFTDTPTEDGAALPRSTLTLTAQPRLPGTPASARRRDEVVCASAPTKSVAPLARSVTLVTTTAEADTAERPISSAKLAAICATTAGAATEAAGSSAPPDAAMVKLKVSCALTEPQPAEPVGAGLPATQAVQAVAPAAEYAPSAHGWHDVEPGSGEKRPAAQMLHVAGEVAPSSDDAVPAAQGTQLVEPVALA